MHIIHQLSDHHAEQLLGLYRQAWWANERTLAETKQCLQGSQLTMGMVNDSDELVAFTRVLTDFVFKAFIFDVIVGDQHRGLGLGDRLIEQVKSHPRLTQVKHFELYCRGDMNDFYVRHGFTAQLGDIQLMRHTRA